MNFETSFAKSGEVADYVSDEELAQRRKRRWIIIAAVVAVLAIIIAWSAFRGGGEDAAAAGGGGAGKQTPTVTVISPGKTQVANLVSATGSLAARREMPVGVVGEGGMVTRVYVEPGSWVAAGQVLASIERSVQSQETGQLSASVNVAQADARLAQSELDRAQALVARGFISKADLDRRTATRDAANARVRVAQAQLGANRARVGRLDIRAPAAGLVLTRAVEPGQVVGGGSGVLFRLARGGEMELRALLGETDLARMAVGMPATVTPVGGAQGFSGQIWQLPPVIDQQTRQGVVRISLAYNRALRPGGFAAAAIQSGMVEAPLLPESAVQSDEKGPFVLLVNKAKKIERRNVQLGAINNQGIPVIGGLTGNEAIVLSAGAFLNPGESVNPVAAKKG